MPFTPFHMGPGLAIKAVMGRHFSLTQFGLTQIAMDIEPLVHILRGDRMLHGYSHTYAGATLIALAALRVGWPVCRITLATWNRIASFRLLRWCLVSTTQSRIPALTGAFIGAYSHVFLDAVMHADLRPWWPFGIENDLLGVIPVGWLHLFCLGCGVAGIMILVVVFVWDKIAIDV